jgi:hypothetical protein
MSNGDTDWLSANAAPVMKRLLREALDERPEDFETWLRKKLNDKALNEQQTLPKGAIFYG